jgi:cobalt/nickel transport system permease protein
MSEVNNTKKKKPGLIRNVDARVKIIVLVFWSIFVALVKTNTEASCSLLGSLVLAGLGGYTFKFSFYKRLFLVNSFLIFIWILLPFSLISNPEDTLKVPGPFHITNQGISLSLLISLKAVAITMGAIVITGQSSLNELLAGAKALGAPEKVISLLLLMTRYISVVGEEFMRLNHAMKIRGFKAKFCKHTFKTIGNFCGNLLLRGVERAERVRASMLCRGYKGKFWVRVDFKLKKIDFLFMLLVTFLALFTALVPRW